MKFLNSKEETIDFQITPYGRFLLSQGKFKPEYYAFFDSDVFYDSEFANYSEVQNDVEERIQQVPQLETQTNFAGVETNINKINNFVRNEQSSEFNKFKNIDKDIFQPNIDKNYSLFNSIGTISKDSTYMPAFKVDVLHGEISSSVNHIAGDFPLDKIPQITLKPIEYQIREKQGPTFFDVFEDEMSREAGVLSSPMKDGSYVDIIEDYCLIHLDEVNIESFGENFEIEVYEIKTQSGSVSCKEELIPLYFKKEQQEIINDILQDKKEFEQEDNLDASFVEYFFDIKIDEEINENIICNIPEKFKKYNYICTQNINNEDIYRTDVKEKEICE